MARALVTGGNRGIGRAIAEGLIAQGHEVVIGVRDLAASQAVAEEMGASVLELDLSQPDRLSDHDMGEVDTLINNAGVLGSGSVLDDPQDFASSLAVMVASPYHLMRIVTPGMIARGHGRIVNLSSGWGAFSEGLAGPGAYGVAKAALNALTLSAARSLPAHVKVNAMCPGWVRTRMGGAGATRSPEEGADTALWLATLPEDGPTGRFFRDRKEIDW